MHERRFFLRYQELKGSTAQRLQDRGSSAAMAGKNMDLNAAATVGRGAKSKKKGAGGAKVRRLGEDVMKFSGAGLRVGDSGAGPPAEAGIPAAGAEDLKERVLLEDFSYEFARGERVGIVGKNGAGKSTFLRLMVGEMCLTQGERRVGETVVFGYYDQRGLEASSSDLKVLDFVMEQVELGNDERRKKLQESGESAKSSAARPR